MNTDHVSTNPDWQVIGELKLPADVNIEETLNVWLAKRLHPLELPVRLLNQILKAAQESAARLVQSPNALELRHLHFMVFAPKGFLPKGQTWGFFQIEKMGTPAGEGHPRDHSIAYYLYLEG